MMVPQTSPLARHIASNLNLERQRPRVVFWGLTRGAAAPHRSNDHRAVLGTTARHEPPFFLKRLLYSTEVEARGPLRRRERHEACPAGPMAPCRPITTCQREVRAIP